MLAAAMNDAMWTGECAEVLKALTGFYPSSFFDGPEIPQTPQETESEARLLREHPEMVHAIERGRELLEKERRQLWTWFRQPPCSIEWMPTSQLASQSVIQKLEAGGAMIEFLLPQEQLQPLLLFKPKTTLQAIAAAIYAERIRGVKYGTCDQCGELFKIGPWSNKRYCDSPRPCKETAKKARQRENEKRAVALLLDGVERGLSSREINREAEEQGIRLTPSAKEQAKQAARKLRKK